MKNENDKNSKIVNEIESYQMKIKQMEEELRKLKGEQSEAVEKLKPEIKVPGENVLDDYFDHDWANSIKMDDDYFITCMSLSHTHIVNLVVGKYGQGNVYTLDHFGDRVAIPHKDLREVIRHHRGLFEQGYFAILSDDFLKKYDLYLAAQKVLNREMIEAIIEAELDVNDIIKLFKSCPAEQQKMLTATICTKLANEPDAYDTYTISKLTRELDIDFEGIADDIQEYLRYRDPMMVR